MSKIRTIRELETVIQSLEADYASVIEQRDTYRTEVAYRDKVRDSLNAAKAEAAIQEKVDGIKAGLIPVEELRRAFDESAIDADGVAFVTYRFDHGNDRIQKALSDVLTAKPKFAEGGYANGDYLGKINSGAFGDAVTFMYPPFKVGDKVNAYRLNEHETLVSLARKTGLLWPDEAA